MVKILCLYMKLKNNMEAWQSLAYCTAHFHMNLYAVFLFPLQQLVICLFLVISPKSLAASVELLKEVIKFPFKSYLSTYLLGSLWVDSLSGRKR